MRLKLCPAILLTACLAADPTNRTDLLQVRAVRHYTLAEATRVVIEVGGEFQYHSERLHNPERVFFDVFKSRPVLESKTNLNRELDDKLLKRIRVAETLPGVTRVVLDLQPAVEVTSSQLANPARLVVELRAGGAAPAPPAEPATVTSALQSPSSTSVRTEPAKTAAAPPSLPPPPSAPAPVTLNTAAASVGAPQNTGIQKPAAPVTQPIETAVKTDKPPVTKAEAKIIPTPPPPASVAYTETAVESVKAPKPSMVAKAEPVVRSDAVPKNEPPAAVAKAQPKSDEPAKAARPTTSSGSNSLIRALGLKVTRVVLDPGHGGHDQGTMGPKGLLEKELVLDVSKRLGKLIEERMGAEVIFTRTDDTFIPLESRTALANEKKADLFLSIHANSSPIPRIAGVETFYLNFTDSRDSLDVASRENASSQKSIFELRDIIQKITLHDKAEESREFAGRIQGALYQFSARSGVQGAARNRGVKKAPFVVLIGATMPSVLAEVGFVSNRTEEANLKRGDYRQKLAEALYRGLAQYAQSLSHFQMAAANELE